MNEKDIPPSKKGDREDDKKSHTGQTGQNKLSNHPKRPRRRKKEDGAIREFPGSVYDDFGLGYN